MTPPPQNPKIYHILNVDKLASVIAAERLHCDSTIVTMNPVGTTIGMGTIKQRRFELPVKCYSNAAVADFVPFYFCPRSVMLYVIHCANSPELEYKGGQGPIVHLEADLHKVIAWANSASQSWAFSGSNAGAAYTSFWNDVNELHQLNWQNIAANQWSQADVKEDKQAEFLMYKSFPWSLVDRIGTRSLDVLHAVHNAIAPAAHKPQVAMMPAWYY
ncbi:type II toxin-antitoxin system toxin DNA ADP-ribosyl transferase DarT [Rhizobium leguminosarum]|uniref:type II toxin-antitoxin system toxin DNA ADP-ribosyl transferase DarT n=1 Tax=Rhizobium leguminosarum TaxID=384 RepID=UPI00160BE4F2|nr:DUF4433 domain-containing protein [Rhizobium leguminosarum]MBB4510625.1 hypothetical protein [Rhizobium leguminosarum]